MSKKASLTAGEKIRAVLRVIGSGKDSVAKALSLIHSNRQDNGQYIISSQDVALLTSLLGVTTRSFDLLKEIHTSGAKAQGIDLDQTKDESTSKETVVEGLETNVISILQKGYGQDKEVMDEQKRIAAQKQREFLISAFSSEVLDRPHPNREGVLKPGFKSRSENQTTFGKFKENILLKELHVVRNWPAGFYGCTDDDVPTQFYVRGEYMDNTVYFVFVLNKGQTELEDEVFGDLYVAGDTDMFKIQGENHWMPVNKFSITPGMQLRGTFAAALHYLITGASREIGTGPSL